MQIDPKTKTRVSGTFASPLPDSNRRPPPYHAIQTAAGGNARQRFPVSSSHFGASGGPNLCHPLRPSVPQLFHPNRPKTPTLDAATMTPRCGLNRSGRSNTHAAVKALRSLGRLERQVLREGAREGELGGVADAMGDAAHRLLALAERPRHELRAEQTKRRLSGT